VQAGAGLTQVDRTQADWCVQALAWTLLKLYLGRLPWEPAVAGLGASTAPPPPSEVIRLKRAAIADGGKAALAAAEPAAPAFMASFFSAFLAAASAPAPGGGNYDALEAAIKAAWALATPKTDYGPLPSPQEVTFTWSQCL